MQSFNNNSGDPTRSEDTVQVVTVGGIDELGPGGCARFELPDGGELALYNVSGEFYATENFCPHRGAPLSEGSLCGHVVECAWHGWRFDVRTGQCLTVNEKVRTYKVIVGEGLIKVEI